MEEVTVDSNVTTRDYSLLSTLAHLKDIEKDNRYGTKRLFNLTVPSETEDVYANAIGIGGTCTGSPTNKFFDLSIVRACTGSVFVNSSDADMVMKSEMDCTLPGMFVTSTESEAETKPTITIDGSYKTLTFNKAFEAQAPGINLQNGIFVFKGGLTI